MPATESCIVGERFYLGWLIYHSTTPAASRSLLLATSTCLISRSSPQLGVRKKPVGNLIRDYQKVYQNARKIPDLAGSKRSCRDRQHRKELTPEDGQTVNNSTASSHSTLRTPGTHRTLLKPPSQGTSKKPPSSGTNS